MASQKLRFWLAGIPVIFLSALFIYFTRPDDSEPVRVIEASVGPLVSSLNTNGKVEPTERRELRAPVPAFVRQVFVKEGDSVRRGQLLMELARNGTAADVARAQADLQAAESELKLLEHGGSAAERSDLDQKLKTARATRDEAARSLAVNERLLARNAIARVDVEQSRERLAQAERELAYLEQRQKTPYGTEERQRLESRVSSARASLNAAREQAGSMRVVAPAAGIAYSVPVFAGNFVNTGDVLARTGNLDSVQVRAYVDEPELGRLAPGLPVEVKWDALPGAAWQGQVERVPTEVVTLGTRSVGEVLCTIANKDHKLLANVNVDVEIVLQRRENALTLPKEAVLHSDGARNHAPTDHYVFVLDGDVVRRRSVKVGASSATRFEILSGLQPGDKIAVPSERPLSDGAKIRRVT